MTYYFRDRDLARALIAASDRGVHVRHRMREAGVHVVRYERPDALPMHAKFVVMQGRLGTISVVGSLNYNRNSRLLNDEVLVESTNRRLAAALLGRFADMAAEIGARKPLQPKPAAPVMEQ